MTVLLILVNQLLLVALVVVLIASIIAKTIRVLLSRVNRWKESKVNPWLDDFMGGRISRQDLVIRVVQSGFRGAMTRAILHHLPYLTGALQEDLVKVLGDLGAVDAIRRRLRKGRRRWTRCVAAYWLSIIRSPEAYDDLVAALNDRDADVRYAAVRAIVHLAQARQALIPMIRLLPTLPMHRAESITEEIVQLGLFDATDAKALLVQQLSDPNPIVRYWSVTLLGEGQAFEAREDLERRLRDADARVREASARALGRLGDPQVFHVLGVAATDPVWKVRLAAVEAIQKLGHPGSMPILSMALMDRQWEVNEAAVRAISVMDAKGHVLKGLLESPHEFVRWRAAEMLEMRGDLDFMIQQFNGASPEDRKEYLRVLRLAAQNRAIQPFQRHMNASPGAAATPV